MRTAEGTDDANFTYTILQVHCTLIGNIFASVAKQYTEAMRYRLFLEKLNIAIIAIIFLGHRERLFFDYFAHFRTDYFGIIIYGVLRGLRGFQGVSRGFKGFQGVLEVSRCFKGF